MLIPQRLGIQKIGLESLINNLPDNLIMAEVGCYQGESATIFLDSGKVRKLYAIDIWAAPGFDLAEQRFDEITKGRDVKKLKMTMDKAIEFLPGLDFIYIDGCHSYEWIKSDVLSSLKRVKKGGIIAGHDYSDNYKDRVVRVVNEILGKPDKLYGDTSWLVKLKK